MPTWARLNTLVLIPKPEPRQVCGIGLLEPLWKLISAVMNWCLMMAIKFHDKIHGFLLGCGTGTACLEAKLGAQLALRSGCPLYHVYLDFSKAYDSIDCSSTLTILQDYGVGPWIIWLLEHFWDQHVVIPHQHAFFSTPFPARQGLTTSNIPAPIIFNIVVDAVLHHWYSTTMAQGMATRAHFYANDRALRDHDPVHLQLALAIMEEMFSCMGLHINGKKTKALAVMPTPSTTNISTVAYKQHMDGNGDTYQECKCSHITCPLCKTVFQARSLPGHYRSLHPGVAVPNPCNQPPWLAPGQLVNYLVSEPDKQADITCPVPSCGITMTRGWYGLWQHFFFCHHTCMVTIIKEEQHPACARCGFQCPLLHLAHQASGLCQAGYDQRLWQASTQAIIMN